MELNVQNIAAVLLGLGALGGIGLAMMHLMRKHVPLWMALLHGALTGPGLVLLIIAVLVHGRIQSRGEAADIERFSEPGEVQMGIAAGMFVLAAIGGIYMFIRHAQRRLPLPPLLILGHGTLALIGYVVLLIAIF